MKKILLSFTLLVVFAVLLSCSKDDDPTLVTKTYVIVPGAWSAPYAWANVKANLEKSGNTVVVVQLPGHGSDHTAPQNLSIDVYRDAVVDAINTLSGQVILVGHSMGGVVISEVAEKIPAKIEKLIYVAAFVPVSGQSLLDLALPDTTSVLHGNLRPSGDELTIDVVSEQIINAFIQDGTTSQKDLVLSNYQTEPLIPFTNKVALTTANYGSVPKVYIKTLVDHTITPDLQKRMLAATPQFAATYALNTGHSPFLVKPDSVAILLTNIVK
ncbi:alpha/beta fold hydrolase [Chryseolinea lacunae]|uniref:Alpha/beta fold hydrolase n=1 Tax=Chryseolinea lacunae TaxID=2801331 RepID=A0ABS1KML7_9BACT|nr:alpha/beta fold hydrolase [Chryseolinea lacunae]MBL0740715.1 alpha/beta fold hydrolase [Chryseolinea lacunae]